MVAFSGRRDDRGASEVVAICLLEDVVRMSRPSSVEGRRLRISSQISRIEDSRHDWRQSVDGNPSPGNEESSTLIVFGVIA